MLKIKEYIKSNYSKDGPLGLARSKAFVLYKIIKTAEKDPNFHQKSDNFLKMVKDKIKEIILYIDKS